MHPSPASSNGAVANMHSATGSLSPAGNGGSGASKIIGMSESRGPIFEGARGAHYTLTAAGNKNYSPIKSSNQFDGGGGGGSGGGGGISVGSEWRGRSPPPAVDPNAPPHAAAAAVSASPECSCGQRATLHCMQCEADYCDKCSSIFHKNKLYQAHQLSPLSDPCVALPFDPWPQRLWRRGQRRISTRVSGAGVMVVDLRCFPSVKRNALPIFVHSLLDFLHSLGIGKVVRILFLLDTNDGDSSSFFHELETDLAAMSIESMSLAWKPRSNDARPSLTDASIRDLLERTNWTDDGLQQAAAANTLVAFVSSRPHLWRTALDHWLSRGRQLLLIHGHGKQPHGLPRELYADRRLPFSSGSAIMEQLERLSPPANKALPSDARSVLDFDPTLAESSSTSSAASHSAAGSRSIQASGSSFLLTPSGRLNIVNPHDQPFSPWTERTCAATLVLISSIWAEKQADGDWGMSALFSRHFERLIGVVCVWDTAKWARYERQFLPTATAPAAHLPSGCPFWNAGISCSGSNASVSSSATKASACLPHICLGCSGCHRLIHCAVNTLLVPAPESLLRDLPPAVSRYFPPHLFTNSQLLAHQQWCGGMMMGLLQLAADRRNVLKKLRTEALIFVDWQNVHVPIHEVSNFLNGLHNFAMQHGASSVRTCRVLLDGSALPDVASYMDQLRFNIPNLDVVSIEARKVQAIDSRLQRMLREDPQPGREGDCTPDTVVLVSGDSDFSPDLARLNALGHHVLLVHNSQAKVAFKQSPLWTATLDFMLLPELKGYLTYKQQQRSERKRATQDALSRGITTRVKTLQPADGDLSLRVPGLAGMCLDVDGRALLLSDSMLDTIMRLPLPERGAAPSGALLAASASSSALSVVGPNGSNNEVRLGNLESFVDNGRSFTPTVLYVIAVNGGRDMKQYWKEVTEPLYHALCHFIIQAAARHRSIDMLSIVSFNDSMQPILSAPQVIGSAHPPVLPSPGDGEANLRTLVESLQQQLHGFVTRKERRVDVVEWILITEPLHVTDPTHTFISDLLNLPLVAAGAGQPSDTSVRLRCSVIVPSEVMQPPTAGEEPLFGELMKIAEASVLRCEPSTAATLVERAEQIAESFVATVEQWRHTMTKDRKGVAPVVRGSQLTQLSCPTDLVSDAHLGMVFVCDTGMNRIGVIEGSMRSKLLTLVDPTESNGQLNGQQHPRHLCMDSKHKRLWFTDVKHQQLCFYQLSDSSKNSKGAYVHAQLRRVMLHSGHAPSSPRQWQVGSKCVSADGNSLLFCDEANQAFFALTLDSAPNSAKRDITATVRLLHQWRDAQPSNAPALQPYIAPALLPAPAASSSGSNSSSSSSIVARSGQSGVAAPWSGGAPSPLYHSLVLDRDGSYLFADTTTHTIKRLVSVADGRWQVSLVAGKGQGGCSDGEAREARFKFPGTLVLDAQEPGSVWIAESGNRRLRKLTIAREQEQLSSSASGGSGSSVIPVDRTSARARAHFKSRPCKHFQKGTCTYQVESDKCAFLHECGRCGGPHGEQHCPHRSFLEQHPFMTLVESTSAGPPGGRVTKEPHYTCQLCHLVTGTLARSNMHIEGETHQLQVKRQNWHHCPHCPQAFDEKDALHAHMAQYHRRNVTADHGTNMEASVGAPSANESAASSSSSSSSSGFSTLWLPASGPVHLDGSVIAAPMMSEIQSQFRAEGMPSEGETMHGETSSLTGTATDTNSDTSDAEGEEGSPSGEQQQQASAPPPLKQVSMDSEPRSGQAPPPMQEGAMGGADGYPQPSEPQPSAVLEEAAPLQQPEVPVMAVASVSAPIELHAASSPAAVAQLPSPLVSPATAHGAAPASAAPPPPPPRCVDCVTPDGSGAAATVYCMDCAPPVFLCAECSTSLHSLRRFQSHRVQPLCTECHQTAVVECEDCGGASCQACSDLVHQRPRFKHHRVRTLAQFGSAEFVAAAPSSTHVCLQCAQTFSSPALLEQHQREQHGAEWVRAAAAFAAAPVRGPSAAGVTGNMEADAAAPPPAAGTAAAGGGPSASAAAAGPASFHCIPCNQSFNSNSQLMQHEQGRPHRAKISGGGMAAQAAAMMAARLECEYCRQELIAVRPSSPPDRRPLVLPGCGHTCCLECVKRVFDTQPNPCCPYPFCQKPITCKLAEVPTNDILIKRVAQHLEARHSQALALKQQHQQFVTAHPYMQEMPARPGKQTSYKCNACNILAGPIHRALAHALLPDLRLKHAEHQHEQPPQPPAYSAGNAAPTAAEAHGMPMPNVSGGKDGVFGSVARANIAVRVLTPMMPVGRSG